MFASLAPSLFAARPETDTAQRDRPRPAKPRPGPVLMTDCITPADHGTLLLALWRRWDDKHDPAG